MRVAGRTRGRGPGADDAGGARDRRAGTRVLRGVGRQSPRATRSWNSWRTILCCSGRDRCRARCSSATVPRLRGSWSWAPTFADAASSEDLGYTTGPYEFRKAEMTETPQSWGHYVSIWRKQRDGSWKVEVELGVSHEKFSTAVADVKDVATPPASAGVRSGAGAKPAAATRLQTPRSRLPRAPRQNPQRRRRLPRRRESAGRWRDARADSEAAPARAPGQILPGRRRLRAPRIRPRPVRRAGCKFCEAACRGRPGKFCNAARLILRRLARRPRRRRR